MTGTLTLRPGYPAFRAFPDHRFHDPMLARNGLTDELGEQQTDAEGKATFDLRLERFEAATYQAHVLIKAFEPEGGPQRGRRGACPGQRPPLPRGRQGLG